MTETLTANKKMSFVSIFKGDLPMVNLNIKETTQIIQSTIISDWKEDPSQTMKSVMLMSGGAGIGKTESMIQVAKDVAESLDLEFTETSTPSDNQFGFATIVASITTASDLAIPTPNADKTKLNYAFSELLPTTGKGILFVDEMGQGDQDVQKFLMQITRARKFNGYELPDGWHVVMATNRVGDNAGVQRTLDTLKDRISFWGQVESDAESWINWAMDNDVDPDVISFIKLEPESLSNYEKVKKHEKGASPRSVTELARLHSKNLTLSKRQRQAMYNGCVGDTVGESFSAFISLVANAPDIEEVLSSPETADVPSVNESNIRYAVASALTKFIKSEQDFENALTYLERFDAPEYSIFTAKLITSKHPELKETKVYSNHLLINKI